VQANGLSLKRRQAAGATAKTFCEFFAGIGLVREGLESSGWRCVYANDIDPKKQAAYEARFGKSEHFHLGDVWNTKEVIKRIPGRPSLMTASFPCIDLSLAGHYRGLEGGHSSTFFGFAKALEALKDRRPPLVMLENVIGFLSSRKGADFATAARRLAELGYWLDAFVLDARHFTPQSRPRVFVIGMSPELKPKEESQKGRLWPVERASVLRPESILRVKERLDLATGWATLPLPDPPKRLSTLAEMIDADDGQAWWDEGEVRRHYELMSDPHQRRLHEIVASKRAWVGTAFRRTRAQLRAEVRFDGLAGCLRTPKGGSAKQIVVAVADGKLRMRWMNPREYACLQGAPDFPLVGTTIQQLWGFADAVCVPAIRWIDRHVLTPLYESVSGAGRNGGTQRPEQVG
jgi:DNA (cytosine-5)-methyltransferase 1